MYWLGMDEHNRDRPKEMSGIEVVTVLMNLNYHIPLMSNGVSLAERESLL